MEDITMGRDLTKRYPSLFDKWMKNPFHLFYEVYKSGKSSEFVSFAVWEIFHKLSLFPKKKYLTFNDCKTLTLDNES